MKRHEIHRLVKYKLYMTDIPDEYINQIIEDYKNKLTKSGYCFLYHHLSDWIHELSYKKVSPFRYLKLCCVYIGKRKAQDESLCSKLRDEVKENTYVIPKERG